MNDESNTNSSENSNQDLSSVEPFSIEDNASQSEENLIDISELVSEVQMINQKMDNVVNISIVSMVGVGLVVGVVMACIFAMFFKH